jgi:CheY-like chemotaxis protein
MNGIEEFRLLFVDDEGDFLATIDEFFASLGYTVYTASNGQEALLRSRSISQMLCFSTFPCRRWTVRKPSASFRR